MTDGPLSPDTSPDDELVSAYVDGEASPEEMARVEANPDLLAAVAVFRSLRDSLADTPPPLAGHREGHLAAALAAFDERDTAAGGTAAAAAQSPAPVNAGGGGGEVISFADRLRQRRTVLVGLASAAAVVLFALAVLPGLFSGTDSADSFADTAAEDGSDESTAAESDGGGESAPAVQDFAESEEESADGADEAASSEDAGAADSLAGDDDAGAASEASVSDAEADDADHDADEMVSESDAGLDDDADEEAASPSSDRGSLRVPVIPSGVYDLGPVADASEAADLFRELLDTTDTANAAATVIDPDTLSACATGVGAEWTAVAVDVQGLELVVVLLAESEIVVIADDPTCSEVLVEAR